jgi:hypothetical protein
MKAKLERTALPDAAQLRRLLAERAEDLVEGATLVDPDARGATGVDLILADASGRPILVDIVAGNEGEVPTRVFEHADWLERNRRLFGRAYAAAGVVRPEEPELVFVAAGFPRAVARAVGSMDGCSVRLIRADLFLVGGEPELLLEEVPRGPRRQGERAQPGRDQGGNGGGVSSRAPEIQSQEVQSLLALLKSGIDGLDGRVREREANGGVAFELDGRPLAFVSTSPVSFTVSPGDRLASPIVVSDRVSLERALNAVVSLYVREHMAAPDVGAGGVEAAGVSEEERAELRAVWGDGIAVGEGG